MMAKTSRKPSACPGLGAPIRHKDGGNVDFPVWMIESLDKEASRPGVTRQSIIEVWLAERLEQCANRP